MGRGAGGVASKQESSTPGRGPDDAEGHVVKPYADLHGVDDFDADAQAAKGIANAALVAPEREGPRVSNATHVEVLGVFVDLRDGTKAFESGRRRLSRRSA
jgi:hypothetical protein